MTFQSISSGSGANSSAAGIILNTTGSAGGLHVTGTGSAGTGGTIQHKTGADITTDSGGVYSYNGGTVGAGIYPHQYERGIFDRMQLNDFSTISRFMART